MKVDVFEFDGKTDHKVGSLVWDGIHFEAIPADSDVLLSILRWPIVGDTGHSIMFDEDPKAFLKNLEFQYNSVSLRASAPYQEDE